MADWSPSCHVNNVEACINAEEMSVMAQAGQHVMFRHLLEGTNPVSNSSWYTRRIHILGPDLQWDDNLDASTCVRIFKRKLDRGNERDHQGGVDLSAAYDSIKQYSWNVRVVAWRRAFTMGLSLFLFGMPEHLLWCIQQQLTCVRQIASPS